MVLSIVASDKHGLAEWVFRKTNLRCSWISSGIPLTQSSLGSAKSIAALGFAHPISFCEKRFLTSCSLGPLDLAA